MFDPGGAPRVFALPPGVDFPRALVAGLTERMRTSPPEAMARVHLIVNTRRMARRIRDLFDAGPALLLPHITLVSDLEALAAPDLPSPPASALRRRLDLVQLVRGLLEQQPDLAARSSAFDLANSLAGLMDEMQGEGVDAQAIRDLDVTDLSGHWARAQAFLDIAARYIDVGSAQPDAEGRQRLIVETLVRRWGAAPPEHPVLVAGSTGSRGTTQMLMQAVARLPQGALVLPGFDFDQPAEVWQRLDSALSGEDHPQFRFARLMQGLDITSDAVQRWNDASAPAPARARMMSLALRPAPFTDAWLQEGPELSGLETICDDMTLVEADSPREEALAIALRLRKAAEDGETAALITPDRMLTRQVTAALDRWGIVPDDSAGQPLHLSPPGRFLRHVADLFARKSTNEALFTLLKHPLCHDNADRGTHLLNTRELELYVRRNGPPFPDAASLRAYQERKEIDPNWIEWVVSCFDEQVQNGDLALGDWVQKLRILSERLSYGGTLWDQNAGQEALAVLTALEREADAGGSLSAMEFGDLLYGLLSQEVVRDRDAPRPDIMIWGTLEARVMGADLLILGGLNEGSWPESPAPDPWLNRRMRDEAGLLLPERRIGLSAHDFQQAANAPQVWLTRARRSEDAETVASRWVNRMTNLLAGLPDQGGAQVLEIMRTRGNRWLDWARGLDFEERTAPALRPSPRPPASARPRKLSVTEIKRLIRDPYAIYARHVLRLSPLDPLMQVPDARIRGILVHEVFEKFVKGTREGDTPLIAEALIDVAAETLARQVPWPMAQRMWLARIAQVADWFVTQEVARRDTAQPILFEARGEARLGTPEFTLTVYADRIDQDAAGTLRIYDYKTGTPPTPAQQAKFDKQLLLEAAIAETVGFAGMAPAPVVAAVYIGLGRSPKEVAAPLDKEPPEAVWADLKQLISAYLEPHQGFTARRVLFTDRERGDYDQLARFGEWDATTEPTPEDLT